MQIIEIPLLFSCHIIIWSFITKLCCFTVIRNFFFAKMAFSFENIDFEPALHFLMDTVDICIKNKVYGFINKKNDDFSVQFIYLGLKSESAKRKAEDNQHYAAKKKCEN